MRITVTVDEPTPEFQTKILALLAEHVQDVETDTSWTEERATQYYRMLPPRARRIVKEAVQRGGMVPADALRDEPDDSLRGHSAPLSRILQRGKMLRRWPEAIEQPVTGVGPGFGKVEGYEIDPDLIPVFQTAIRTVEKASPVHEAVDRQVAALRLNQEPLSAFQEEQQAADRNTEK